MMRHIALKKNNISLIKWIREGKISLGGNESLKIYGSLSCRSGKRMKKERRVFFESEEEAILLDYRPCAHCMRKSYLAWKEGEARLRHK